MEEIISVGLVEDHQVVREGLKSLLHQKPDIQVVFESPNGYSVLERLRAAETIPQVMLVDLTLPPHGSEAYNGMRVLENLQQHYSHIRILILSMHEDPSLIAHYIKKGAHGYLVKDVHPAEVYEAIKAVHKRGAYVNERVLQAVQEHMHSDKILPTDEKLTKRELEILELVCQQMTTEEIAEKLFISIRTVNGHRNNLLQKTGSRNVTGLVMYAIKNQLVKAH